jgi:branched-chain amino acid transport system substrate-binding protein
METSRSQASAKRNGRRDFLARSAGVVLATGIALPRMARAASTDPQKVRDALAPIDVSTGYAAMCPGGKVKFGPDGKNIYAHPVGVQ